MKGSLKAVRTSNKEAVKYNEEELNINKHKMKNKATASPKFIYTVVQCCKCC